MGFFSGLLGGSKSSSSSGGFNALPNTIKGAYTGYGQQLQDLLNSGNLTNMYKPLAQTAGETQAYNAINQGFTPTAATLASDISMQMNPYDDYVIGEINRQAGGDYSILKQSLNEAGQMGSNRQMIGANDIDLSRLNQIGQFKQQGYNQALQNAMSVLPGMRSGDAEMQLGAAGNQRALDLQDKQAQLTALQQFAAALGILPTAEGSTTTSSKSGGGLSGLLSAGASAYAASDRRAKDNVIKIGEKNGFNIYSFRYKPEFAERLGMRGIYTGVMAQEVGETRPDAVSEVDGILNVNYDAIGIEMQEVV